MRCRFTCAVFGLLWFSLLAQADSPPVDPNRLDHRVLPIAQSLELTLNPASDGFTGRAAIQIRVHERVSSFRFHAKGPKISQASLDAAGHAVPLTVATTQEAIGIVTATAEKPIEPGDYTVRLEFASSYRRDGLGLYKTEYQGAPYLFTQMQDLHLRTAMPAWDDPEFKIPFQVTLVVPRGLTVVSNAPLAYSEERDGFTVHHFGRTPPMPSYLLAIAVGPLETRPVSGLPVPGRIVTAKGQLGQSAEILRLTPAYFDSLERYFGVPYPYGKLDQIAVPEFVYGGMENAGAITYRDNLVLFGPEGGSVRERQFLHEIVAHEIAHMWFGNLVTMRWWTDLWLNESFATWISYKMMQEIAPELRPEASRLESVHEAMTLDAQVAVEPIRREMLAGGDISSLVDTLTYNKGQAILDMTEAWISPETFRVAMKNYFRRHAWANTDAVDLWRAFDEAAGQDVTGIIMPFVTQPGIPLVQFEIVGGDTLRVTQRRFFNQGSREGPERWQVPLFVRYFAEGKVHDHRLLLRDASADYPLPSIGRAEWIQPNFGVKGYYRWALESRSLAQLSRAAETHLSYSERMNLLANVTALFRAGLLDGGAFLDVVTRFVPDREPEVASKALEELVVSLEPFRSPERKDLISSALRSLLRPVVDRVGWKAQLGELPATSTLRGQLLFALGDIAEEPSALAEARQLTADFLDAKPVDPSLIQSALLVAAAHGDAAHYSRVVAALEKATNPGDRRRLLASLGGFKDPAIVKRALDYSLTGPLNSVEILTVPQIAARTESNKSLVAEWIIQNYDVIVKRAPPFYLGFLVEFAEGNDPEVFARLRDFLLAPERVVSGAEKNAGLAQERVQLRRELRERETDSIVNGLRRLSTALPDRP